MKRIFTLLFCLFWGISFSLFAQIHQVPADFSTIQEAIDASQNGDTVVVSPGTYFENISFNGKDILLTSLFYAEKNVEHIFNTTIDGSQPTTDTGSVVRFIHGEGEAAVLQGFTITGGTGTVFFNSNENTYFRVAGGILIDQASPTIQFNVVENNEAVDVAPPALWAGGGGLRGSGSRSVVQNNIFRNNRGGYAAGMIFGFSHPTIRNNLIVDNEAGTSADGGGGIFIDFSIDYLAPVPIVNNTIVNNHSDGKGGGIIVTGWRIHSQNNIIYGNTSGNGDPQIFLRNIGVGPPSEAIVDYTDLEGGGFSGTDNLDMAPGLTGDYFTLPEASPLIDAGNPNTGFNDREEGGQLLPPALGTARNDIGWSGGPHAFDWSAVASAVFQTSPAPFSFWVKNPMGRSGTISINMEKTERVSLDILDTNGHVLKNIHADSLAAGEHVLPFDFGVEIPPGSYFVRLSSLSGQVAQKVILN